MPYSGFEGFAYVNQANGRNDYVRKHNPAVMFDSVATNADRLSRIKNLTQFQVDLDGNKLPQWMFITPNMVRVMKVNWRVFLNISFGFILDQD